MGGVGERNNFAFKTRRGACNLYRNICRREDGKEAYTVEKSPPKENKQEKKEKQPSLQHQTGKNSRGNTKEKKNRIKD